MACCAFCTRKEERLFTLAGAPMFERLFARTIMSVAVVVAPPNTSDSCSNYEMLDSILHEIVWALTRFPTESGPTVTIPDSPS